MFKPGETFPLLRSYLQNIGEQNEVTLPLSKANVYFFDSESFRFLAAKLSNVTSIDDDKDYFVGSWRSSY